MLHVLDVSTEIHPWLKTGGLADVNGALPAALIAAGIDVRLLVPAFPALRAAASDCGPARPLVPAVGVSSAALLPCRLGGVPARWLDCPALFARDGGPYSDADGRDWPDNLRRFALLGWAAARLGAGDLDPWRPAVVHSHDWHAALANAYLAIRGGARPASVFTVHNLAYQGQFAAAEFATLDLPDSCYASAGLEFYGHVNCMKAGLYYADRITTVSATYAREIQTAEHGHGLDGLLRARAAALRGILNGVDAQAWDPARDPVLLAHFSAADVAGKQACKSALSSALGLHAGAGPLVGVVSRLTPQKGLDLLLACLPQIVAADARIALLGGGRRRSSRHHRSAPGL